MDEKNTHLNKKIQKHDIDKLISEVDRCLQDIETDEIIGGFTSEELHERGYTSEKPIRIERSKYMLDNMTAGFMFPQGVEFAIHPPVKSASEIDLSIAMELPVVEACSVTISRPLPEKYTGFDCNSIYGKDYIDECNLAISVVGNELRFVPRVDGRLVLAGEMLYLIPSNKDGTFTIRITDNNMKAIVDFTPPKGKGRIPTLQDVLEELTRMGVKAGICTEAIKSALEQLKDIIGPLCNIVAAMGVPPVDGKDGEIVFHFDINPSCEECRILPDGRIDYRKNASIPVVNKGDILAELTSPIKGNDGLDIFGNTIKARSGKNVELFAGTNVTIDEHNIFRAACSGQAVLNGSVLEVLQHYIVDGNVDYHSGNIRFNGNVTIRGNVYPGFEVIADGDIEVHGICDGALLKSGRDIRVEAGIIGRGDNRSAVISCGRDLVAKHIQNGFIEAQGNVIVRNSIVQSTIKAGGSVIIRGGSTAAIIGGYLCALNGISAINIGSEYGVRTTVEAGNDYLMKKTCEEIKEAIAFCVQNIEKIKQVFNRLKNLIKDGTEIDSGRQTKILQLKEKHKQLSNFLSIMTHKKDKLQKQSLRNFAATICVSQTIFPGVLVRILDKQKVINDSMNRICFKYDCEKCDLIIVPFSKGSSSL